MVMLFFILIVRRPARPTLFPYTTLFRSHPTHAPPAGPRPTRPAPSGTRSAESRPAGRGENPEDRKSTRLNSSHGYSSYAVFCLKKKNHEHDARARQDRFDTHPDSVCWVD